MKWVFARAGDPAATDRPKRKCPAAAFGLGVRLRR